MNSKVILFTLLALVLGFSACDKTDDDEITRTPLIKTMSIYENDQLRSQQSFEYDHLGRLLKKSYPSGDWISYNYAPDTVFENRFIAQWQATYHDTLLLNNKGLAISCDQGASTMEYDMDGYLIRKNDLIGERYSYLYEIENGNRTVGSMIANNQYLTKRVMQTNEFLPNSTNTIGDENMGITFLGKQNKDLISNIQYSQGTLLTIIYEYDSENRVSKWIGSNDRSVVYTYY